MAIMAIIPWKRFSNNRLSFLLLYLSEAGLKWAAALINFCGVLDSRFGLELYFVFNRTCHLYQVLFATSAKPLSELELVLANYPDRTSENAI